MDSITKLTCNRCGKSWWPKSPKLPLQCPKCRSPYWNRERKHPKKEEGK